MDPVKFRDCQCPGTPHAEGDTVRYRPRLSFDANRRALAAITTDPKMLASAAWEVYLLEGPEAWNLVDANGKDVALTADALLALDWTDQYEIANRADDIYGGQVLAPLVQAMKKSSPSTPTRATSRRRTSSSGTTRA